MYVMRKEAHSIRKNVVKVEQAKFKITFRIKWSSINDVTLFRTIFDPLPLSHALVILSRSPSSPLHKAVTSFIDDPLSSTDGQKDLTGTPSLPIGVVQFTIPLPGLLNPLHKSCRGRSDPVEYVFHTISILILFDYVFQTYSILQKAVTKVQLPKLFKKIFFKRKMK